MVNTSGSTSNKSCKTCSSSRSSTSSASGNGNGSTGSILDRIFGRTGATNNSNNETEGPFECCEAPDSALLRAIQAATADLSRVFTTQEIENINDCLVCAIDCDVTVKCDNVQAVAELLDKLTCQLYRVGVDFFINEKNCRNGEKECTISYELPCLPAIPTRGADAAPAPVVPAGCQPIEECSLIGHIHVVTKAVVAYIEATAGPRA